MTAAAKGISRRDALRRGAVVGGALVWTVPVVQSLSLTPAYAESPSAPGNPGNPEVPPVQPPAAHNPPAAPPAQAAPSGEGSGGLAATGAAVPLLGAVALASGAIAVGAGVVAASRKRRENELETD